MDAYYYFTGNQLDIENPYEREKAFRVSLMDVGVMAEANPNFVTEQRAIYDAIRAQAAVRREAAAAEA